MSKVPQLNYSLSNLSIAFTISSILILLIAFSNLKLNFFLSSQFLWKSWKRRLVSRKTDTPDKIKQKVEAAAREMAYSQVDGNFDKVLVNANVESVFVELVHVLQGWFPDLDLFLE